MSYNDLTDEQKEKSRAAHRKWAANNPRTEYYKEYDDIRYNKRIPQRMYNSAKTRAVEANLPFDITLSDIIVPAFCPICNHAIISAKGVRGGTRNSPTLDRVICSEGYVKGNIAVICKNCNSLKGHATSDELRQIADWIDSFK